MKPESTIAGKSTLIEESLDRSQVRRNQVSRERKKTVAQSIGVLLAGAALFVGGTEGPKWVGATHSDGQKTELQQAAEQGTAAAEANKFHNSMLSKEGEPVAVTNAVEGQTPDQQTAQLPPEHPSTVFEQNPLPESSETHVR